jgi:hypothetical protein
LLTAIAMLTDMRPVVERLLRKLVLAGLPLVSACETAGPIVQADGSAGGDGAAGTTGGGGSMAAAGTTGSGGTTGQVACQPFSLACGPQPSCTFPGADGGFSFEVPLSYSTIDFDPNDTRWVSLYRSCVASGQGCGADCQGWCKAVAQFNGVSNTFGYVGCEVTCGTPNRVKIAYATGACGRRPGGLGCEAATEGSPVARFLAESAALEAASVPAFARLARGLAAHGAPEHLVRAARAATAEEARHWRRTRDVARGHGGDPVRPRVKVAQYASLEELALDNVVEGCVRETFGALVAAHQAVAAGDRAIRDLMADIAEEELGHATLSWQIDAWACEQLGPELRARRSQVARAAVGELALASREPIADELTTDAGLPGQADVRELLVTTWETTWQPRFAA